MSIPTSDQLCFPSQEAIAGYLAKHPLTSDPYNVEKRINEAAAKLFANSTKTEAGIKMGVSVTMYNQKKTLGLSESLVCIVSSRLTQALIDCAKGDQSKLKQ